MTDEQSEPGHLFIFGMGYAAQVLAHALRARGWQVTGTGRAGTIDFADAAAVHAALARASHVLSSVPPAREGGDPVLQAYGPALNAWPGQWIGYWSSTGVYGDARGAWVDETAPIGGGRRSARVAADLAWQAWDARVRVLRLPGIYGPGRSVIDKLREGTAHRIIAREQVFSRIHVDDIAGATLAAFAGPPGVYNLADEEPASQNAVVEEAARLTGLPLPPLLTADEAELSPMARGFYAESRRVAAGKARRLLDWRPIYPTYREGLRALSAMTSPTIASAEPATASSDQR
ncbi:MULTISPECIES: SDR family NAD(P)-dependent oxidoreductase [unclassified Novosphingobium]|uniref:SDR family NAD(P)-dependent oxidoreductase n=1 Tax=unclassified Novosphingobium TaxID=2644732 RepID=UPI00146B6269|nr:MULTISPECIES: SDR family NAD(P)-dependent oxidoreductase [unclassified Novosphingobium]NMN05549.1 nucleoside-diphosphate-sugar epimerase [Novosphingobium sp. SG919]NMN88092.1 nucleoside-diphosphate-sugar epimerase [Novosphingobium sp. SG916]